MHPRQGMLGEAAWRVPGSRAELLLLGNIGHGVEGDNRASLRGMPVRMGEFVGGVL